MYNTLNIGLAAVIAAFCIALTILGIYASVGLYKILSAKAQAIQTSQPQAVVVHKRQPSPEAQRARQREREERERDMHLLESRINQFLPDTEPVWSATDDKTANLKPEEYPWAV